MDKLLVWFLDDIKDNNVSSEITYLIFLSIIFILVFVGAFKFWFGHRVSKEDKQYEIISQIINSSTYLANLIEKPQVIRQILYSRMIGLRGFDVFEVDYLLEQKKFPYTLYELKALKNSGFFRFCKKEKKYELIENKINRIYKREPLIINILAWILLFLLIFPVVILTTLFNSIFIFLIGVLLLIILEISIINKHEAVTIFRRNEELL